MNAIQTADGCFISDVDGQMVRLAKYFEQLFTSGQLQTAGLPSLDADPPIDETASSIDDFKETVAKLRGGKAACICTISMELHRAGSEAIISEMYAVLTAVRHSGTIPLTGKRIWSSLSGREKRTIRTVATTVV